MSLCLKIELRLKETWSSQHLQDSMEELQSLVSIFLISACQRIFSHCNRCETFRKDITSFMNRLTISCDSKEHMTITVYAMCFNKIYRRFRSSKPLSIFTYIIAQSTANIAEASLEPHRLCCIHQFAISIKSSIYTTIDMIESIFHPERHDILYKTVHAVLSTFLYILYIYHKYYFIFSQRTP